ncbi:hypothetical protein EW146_g5635 [Bondarzewia mesenterica]|uniref:Uncharacterized protein n=1 Tax=Bondarzewia mesenterica TaxID=1095465 RepID=A0A4V3XES1_9AGAM|nr:hypothetical protein EW146_g5635 [Bondarzewia mesenterica]
MYVFTELGYDSLIFLLTITRTMYMHWMHKGAGPGTRTLVDKLIRDGAAYFAAIFTMNLTWVLMIMYAPTGLRGIASVPSSCVTTVMITRITLNLRTTVYGPAQHDERTRHSIPLTPLGVKRRTTLQRRRFDPTATENLTVHVRTEVERDDVFGRSWEGGAAVV